MYIQISARRSFKIYGCTSDKFTSKLEDARRRINNMEEPNDPFISAFGVDYAAHFGDPLKAIEGALRVRDPGWSIISRNRKRKARS